jgi:anti-sigma factor RsiW
LTGANFLPAVIRSEEALMNHFPILTLLLLGGVTASAVAQNQAVQDQPQPSTQATNPIAPSASNHSVTLQEPSGPVTVTWGQPQTLPNAADYQIKISDLDRNGDGVLRARKCRPIKR